MADAAVKFDLTATEYAQSARSSVAREKPEAKMKPTVAIVEDHLGCLEDLTKLIAKEYEIVAVATDGKRLGFYGMSCPSFNPEWRNSSNRRLGYASPVRPD